MTCSMAPLMARGRSRDCGRGYRAGLRGTGWVQRSLGNKWQSSPLWRAERERPDSTTAPITMRGCSPGQGRQPDTHIESHPGRPAAPRKAPQWNLPLPGLPVGARWSGLSLPSSSWSLWDCRRGSEGEEREDGGEGRVECQEREEVLEGGGKRREEGWGSRDAGSAWLCSG